MKINRKSLIEILVDNLKSLKIKNIVILTGFNSKELKIKLKRMQSTLIIPITKQIIYTLCFILKKLNQSSLCLFSDVIFDKKILVNLIKSKQDIVLAVDKKSRLKNTMRVKIKNSCITDIGNHVKSNIVMEILQD